MTLEFHKILGHTTQHETFIFFSAFSSYISTTEMFYLQCSVPLKVWLHTSTTSHPFLLHYKSKVTAPGLENSFHTSNSQLKLPQVQKNASVKPDLKHL